jgi:hypothetical protein
VQIEVVTKRRDALRFYELYRTMQSTCGLAMIDREEFAALFELVCAPGELGVALHATIDDEVLGGLYVLRSRSIVFPSQYALAKRDGRGRLPASISIGPMLWWEAIRWGQRNGCRILDVEGYRPASEEGAGRPGMYAFKQRMRPKHVTIITQHSRTCHQLHGALLRGRNSYLRIAGQTRRLCNSRRAA